MLLTAACLKLPVSDVNAGFDLADASWFQDEETLFFFYEVSAEQGLNEASVIEVTYRTDTETVPWTRIDQLEYVHPHLPVDCGFTRRCGSLSLHVPDRPREVGIRLRYHEDGELALTTETVFNAIGSGPAHSNRSFLVYGVFTANNQRVQWRGRHRFPTLRNEQVQELGLRRRFQVDAHAYGSADFPRFANPYGYGVACPLSFVPLGFSAISTQDRAVFDTQDLPQEAATSAQVCARATVLEPRAPFVTSALAQKNPEVEPAFPVLRTPIHEATPIKFFLAPCDRTIDADHEEMQRQRILYDGPATCVEDWRAPDFVDRLVGRLEEAIEATRPAGEDMVLVMALHRENSEDELADQLEEVLSQILPSERDRATPRVVGAFVFDSEIRDVRDPVLNRLILWCPASIVDDEEVEPGPSNANCAITPDNVNLSLGPFSLSFLPILPSRNRYLDFIDRYSKAQAGEVKELTFLVPEFTPTTDNTQVGGLVATFFNQEIISAQPEDAFSFCPSEEPQPFVFRTEISKSDDLDCPPGQEPTEDDFCLPPPQDFLPIEFLPMWHDVLQEQTYELGLLWDFPWLMRATYEVVAAASASAFGLSVPFGFGAEQMEQLGAPQWLRGEFPLAERLAHCKRFCDHPTFDSAGIYNVTRSFRSTYLDGCYRPSYPALGDSSFPRDP